MKEIELTGEQVDELKELSQAYEEQDAHASGLLKGFDAKQKAERDAFIETIKPGPNAAAKALRLRMAELAGVDPETMGSASVDLLTSKLKVAEEGDPCDCPSCQARRSAFKGLFEGLAKAVSSHKN